MIIATLRIQVQPKKRNEALELLKMIIEPTQVEPGCISCRFYRDLNDETAMTLVEEWRSQADLDRRLGSKDYEKILALMDMSSMPPRLKFHTVSHTEGMEALEAVREFLAFDQT